MYVHNTPDDTLILVKCFHNLLVFNDCLTTVLSSVKQCFYVRNFFACWLDLIFLFFKHSCGQPF